MTADWADVLSLRVRDFCLGECEDVVPSTSVCLVTFVLEGLVEAEGKQKTGKGDSEVRYVSTCNRVEQYQ